MPISSIAKKALFCLTAVFLSLASALPCFVTPQKETKVAMRDSLYDPWVSSAYDTLPENAAIDLCLDGFYAPVYFSNLRENFGTNRFGTCAFVAMSMLLSFYDTYWDDSIVPSEYEIHSMVGSDFPSDSIESPGSRNSSAIVENATLGEYFNSIVPGNEGTYLDMKLISLASYFMGFSGVDSYQTGLDYSGLYSLFQYYLYSYMCFSRSDIGFAAEPGTGTGQAKSDSVREWAISMVLEGVPVLLSVGNDPSAKTGRHAVIAYDYDERNDLLYCHMGWGPKATHVTIESFGYTSYNSAFIIAARMPHSCSDNYIQIANNNQVCSNCACKFAAPYDIKSIDWYRNEEPGFEWSCLNEEKWTGDFERFELSFAGYCGGNETASEKRWKVSWDRRYNVNPPETSIYDSQTISVTINSFYEDDYHGISGILRTATFPGVMDFEGAYNIHPGDYAYSPNGPMQTGDTAHCVNGLSFVTNRCGVFEAADMVSLAYAGGGYNNAYIRYKGFPSGVSIIGIDFGIRLWENTAAPHGLKIERWDGDCWQVDADLLGNGYDIAGSDGEVRWIHHSFGTPVSAFAIHAFSSGASFSESSAAGLLTMAIYTVNDATLPTSGSELPYRPDLWNDNAITKKYSNCYRYALNFPNFSRTQLCWEPGSYAINGFYQGQNKEIVVGGALMDAHEYKADHPSSAAFFRKIGRIEACPSGCYKVALFINRYNNGFHWFRQDGGGNWSQKNGSDPVTNLDNGGNLIIDPQFCETSYNIFCGYYCVGPWTNYGMSSN